jgi:hypothetical protein
MSAKLEELTLDEIESRMVFEARDIDVESKVEYGFGAFEHPPCPHCGRTNHPHKRPKKKTGKFPKKNGYKKDSDKSEGAGATMHQVYSVMARAGPEEWILDSGASAHMTGIKSLLKDYKEVAMTTVTVANGDILPAKNVGNISFKTEHGYVTFTGVLHVRGLDRSVISVPQLTSKSLAIRMLKDKCVISGKKGHVMTVKKSGSIFSINCYTAQVAVTDTSKSESPRFPDDVKYSTELCLWNQRFGHLASKSIVSLSIKRLVEGLPKLDQSLESIAPLFTGCILESLIKDHPVLLLKKLSRLVKNFIWISKIRWI